MTPAWRWLVALGWGIPLAVAATVSRTLSAPLGARPLADAGAVLILTAPVLPLSVILFALAVAAGRRTGRAAGSAFGRIDSALLRAATAGIAVSLALVAVTIVLYVT